ncbi:acetylxylan esterase [Dermatophilaceae bacterium Sec6.4]
MAFYDLPAAELATYDPQLPTPADLRQFWDDTLSEARSFPLAVQFTPVQTPLTAVEVYDVTFAGWGGHPIKAWLLVPVHREGRLPCIVGYLGYSAGRGYPHQWLTWPSAGFATLVMDTRGQGWSPHTPGATADPVGSGPSVPGFLTKGVESRETYYYRRVYTDAVRAIEAARSHPRVDPDRIGLEGGSQGGGLAMAAGALCPDVRAVAANVPFLTHIRRATEIGVEHPYAELVQYLRSRPDRVEETFATLSYFDVAVLARLATAPAIFAAGLMDPICPPSCCYAAFNAWGGPKEVFGYPYNQHEGGSGLHDGRVLQFFRDRLG